jgi:CBS domain containing-hemolysin-like protein
VDAQAFVWFVLAALLAASALLSGSETALFGLRPSDERTAGPRARALITQPRSLLVTILLANLGVNMLFFAFATRLYAGHGARGEWLGGIVALVTLVVFGEVLPKAVALRARVAFSRVGAVPLSFLVAALRPVQRAADRTLTLIYRALGPAGHEEHGVTAAALSAALEKSAQRGLLLENEAEFLAGVIELDQIKVRELMTPRVDMLFLDLADEDRTEVVGRGLASKAPWVVVVDGDPDHVVGRVRLRTLLAQPGRALREILEPVVFVPEVASGVQLLELLRAKHVAQAVAVDEWGGTAGLVTIEDLFEHVVGDLRVEGEASERAVVPLGDGRFEVVGHLPIRDWNDMFGQRVVPGEFDTVGGLVLALLGRIPRAGDVVRAGPLGFEVREVRRRRVVKLEISVVGERGAAA